MDKILWPSLIIALSFAIMSLLASLGSHSPKDKRPSTRMTTGTMTRRYYDHPHSMP